GSHQALRSFPTRRASDLNGAFYRLRRNSGCTTAADAAVQWLRRRGGKPLSRTGFAGEFLSAPDCKTDYLAESDSSSGGIVAFPRSEEHTSELQSRENLVW